MSEGAMFYLEPKKESFALKVELSEALFRSRKLLTVYNGMEMSTLNTRPFLKFFKKTKKYSLNVNRKKKTNFSKKVTRNTFVGKNK